MFALGPTNMFTLYVTVIIYAISWKAVDTVHPVTEMTWMCSESPEGLMLLKTLHVE